MFPTLRAFILSGLVLSAGCGKDMPPIVEKTPEPVLEDTVVVYTALDEMFSQPILDGFEKSTGIDVQPVYDTEAAKTTGLRTRLVAEKDRPRADVFWNNEVAQTILLKNEDVLEPYGAPTASRFPPEYLDSDGYWTGFAARARVIVYNTDLMKEPPTSIQDFLKPEWKGKAAIGKPLFGTTATHAAALFALQGDEEATKFFEGLKANEVAVLEGNATVRDRVASGDFAFGLTDTDDANGAVLDGRPVKWVFPDQGEEGIGTLFIPNTVALIKGAPHPNAAKKLIDYLLSAEVERQLAVSRSLQIPLNPDVPKPEGVPDITKMKAMGVTYEAIAGKMPTTMEYLQNKFLQ